jgi:hypothetical protein
MPHRGKEGHGKELERGNLLKDRQMDRLGCEMTHLKWKKSYK